MWKPVDSSNISKVRYSKGTLEVEFKRGGKYKYYKVPEKTYDGLLKAESKGEYFVGNIKHTYEYNKTGE